ncbi:sel1 repeat family protein [uncultured Desulfovibrio sp.]|uniref:sel1 repeat family protein n=1 Tax=uncultured Desulfovibrio sp. TaxID=167968 RepID=UPI002601D433|nr:sel1 repeat family protein [uncultured Desulfovibrio sp.]
MIKAFIAPDAARTPGVAIISVYGAPGTGPADVAIYSGEGKYLSASGWQESRTPLPVEAHDDDSGCLRLQVGPAVVDNLDKLERYLFIAGEQKCGLQIQDLVYSRMEGGHGMGQPVPAAPVQPAPQPAPAPEPEPDPVPAPEPETEAPPPLLAEPPLEMDRQAAATEKKSSGSLLWIILGLVLLALAAAAIWWFFLRATPPPPPMTPQTPETQQGTQDKSAPAATEPAPAALPPLQQAREHLRGTADPETSLKLALPLRTQQAGVEESDAAFLLLEDAAQKGNVEAMFLVGQFYDPQASLPRGSLPADMSQAKHWYESAKAKGHAGADKALADLHRRVEAEAAKGNAEAAFLLRDWK